jgi:hypothetical protein
MNVGFDPADLVDIDPGRPDTTVAEVLVDNRLDPWD